MGLGTRHVCFHEAVRAHCALKYWQCVMDMRSINKVARLSMSTGNRVVRLLLQYRFESIEIPICCSRLVEVTQTPVRRVATVARQQWLFTEHHSAGSVIRYNITCHSSSLIAYRHRIIARSFCSSKTLERVFAIGV